MEGLICEQQRRQRPEARKLLRDGRNHRPLHGCGFPPVCPHPCSVRCSTSGVNQAVGRPQEKTFHTLSTKGCLTLVGFFTSDVLGTFMDNLRIFPLN